MSQKLSHFGLKQPTFREKSQRDARKFTDQFTLSLITVLKVKNNTSSNLK